MAKVKLTTVLFGFYIGFCAPRIIAELFYRLFGISWRLVYHASTFAILAIALVGYIFIVISMRKIEKQREKENHEK